MAFRLPLYIQSGSTSTAPILREYTSSDVWNKPSGLKYIIVACLGAGGGGGSGRFGTGTPIWAGRPGGGGALARLIIPANDLPSSVTITIGAGGVGAPLNDNADTNGTDGSNGGDTSFGTLVIAQGGRGGPAGNNNASEPLGGDGGRIANCTPDRGPWSISGARGYLGTLTFAPPGMDGFSAAPASGRSLSRTVAGGNAGARGGGGVYTGTSVVNGGANNGSDGTSNQAKNLLFSLEITGSYGVGTAGGGNGAGAKGGNGGNYGASGAGGGRGIVGTDLQAGGGGNGADGLLQILEIYN